MAGGEPTSRDRQILAQMDISQKFRRGSQGSKGLVSGNSDTADIENPGTGEREKKAGGCTMKSKDEITPKERMLAILQGKEVDRLPGEPVNP